MPRDLNSAASEPVPLPVIDRAIRATPYRWRDPASIPERRWVYGHQLLRGAVTVVVAPGATGKTALMIGTALALVSGRPLLGKTVWGGPKTVWLWNLEDSGEELARGLQAAALHWDIGPDALDRDDGSRLFVDSGLDGAELKVAREMPGGARINGPVVSALVEQLKTNAIDVLIVDPFVSSHAVSENDNNAIDMVAKQWARVATQTGCAIVLVHHARKLAGAEVSAETARGASSLIAAARSVLTLNRMSDEEAPRFGIEGEDRRRYFRVYDDKNNRAPPADRSDWYRLHSVSLGNGSDGGDSLPVVVPWSPPDAFDGVDVSHLRAVQERLSAGEYRKDVQARSWAGEAVAEVLKLNLTKKVDKARASSLLRTWEANGAIVVEMRDDERRRPKAFYAVGHWAEDGVAPPAISGVEQG
ncbi:helicase RepA family protein [Sphingomonas sp. MMSM20]|uniref:AAA family ATPase n=1 Tax=Sphingomonas lycopersici TaxID=2951807 RepID=UPI002238207D|nr:helicase RepA family protein [Sphingomonas lycopersici]MCW6529725.1 helicase RepA family protein [Sphingomonas lycopersici]